MQPDLIKPEQTPRSKGLPGMTSMPDFGIDPALLPSGGGVPPFMASNPAPTLSGARAADAARDTTAGPPLDDRQRAAADALRLALDEGHVYAALTGPAGVGKTKALEAVLAEERDLRVLRIEQPDAVTGELAARIENIALAQAAKLGADQHVAIVVDDAHAASVELLDSLARLATARRAGGRMPQVLLVGQPLLWERLKAERFKQLERRVAMRHELLAVSDEDPWASVQRALSPARTTAAAASRDAVAAEPVAAPSGPASSFGDVMARIGNVEEDEARRFPSVLFALLAVLVIASAAVGAAGWFGLLPPGLVQRFTGGAPAAPPTAPVPPSPPAPVAAAPPPSRPAQVAAPAPASRLAEVPRAAAPAPVSAPLPASPPRPPAPAASPPAPPMAAEMISLMIQRGEDRLALGDIAAARSFFERAAAGGSGRAELLAGRTYDPAFLPPEAAGMASVAQAAGWYRRAEAGGDADAALRLRQLGGASR